MLQKCYHDKIIRADNVFQHIAGIALKKDDKFLSRKLMDVLSKDTNKLN